MECGQGRVIVPVDHICLAMHTPVKMFPLFFCSYLLRCSFKYFNDIATERKLISEQIYNLLQGVPKKKTPDEEIKLLKIFPTKLFQNYTCID